MADCIIAGGTESMSMVPMTGLTKTAFDWKTQKDHPSYYLQHGIDSGGIGQGEYEIHKETSRCIVCKVSWESLAAIGQLGKWSRWDRTVAKVEEKPMAMKRKEKDTEIHCWYRWRTSAGHILWKSVWRDYDQPFSRMVGSGDSSNALRLLDGASLLGRRCQSEW